MTIQEADRYFNELDTGVYAATLEDEDGNAISLASIDSITLTLFNDDEDQTIINDREAQDVLNTNNVTIHETSGLLTWTIQQDDNSIIGSTVPKNEYEKHFALFTVVFNTTKRKSHIVPLYVKQLSKITS